MRTRLTFVIVLFSCLSCQGHVTKKIFQNSTTNLSEGLDTLNTLGLTGIKYDGVKYKIIHIVDFDKGQEQIQLLENNIKTSTIWLPVADEEVKNFSFSKMEETQKGFKILVDWGGGNDFYQRTFFFSFKAGKFYLDNLVISNFTQEPEKKKTKRKSIRPPIEISQLNILDYINNEL